MNGLNDFVAELVRGQQIVRDATAWVEYEHDPKVPGRTGYRITGKTAAVVQGAIDARMAECERAGGVAEFTHPVRQGDRYVSLGYVHKTQPEPSDAFWTEAQP